MTQTCAHVNSSLTAVQKKEEGKEESEKVAQRERECAFPLYLGALRSQC